MENITESEHEESSTDDLQRKIAALHTCNFIHTVKGFDIVNKAEINVFLDLSCFFYDPMDIGNLISASFAFSYCLWNSQSKNTEVVCHSLPGGHPPYITYMQSTSFKMLGWMKYKLESRLPGAISITSDMQMTPPLWQKVKKN